MKYLVLLIVAGFAISIPEIEAKPLLISDLINIAEKVVDTSGTFVGNAFDTAGDLAGKGLQLSTDALTAAIKLGTGIGSGIAKGVGSVTVATLEVIDQVYIGAVQALTDQIDAIKSKVLQRAITEFKNQVSSMQVEIEKLCQKAKDKLSEANKKSEDFVAVKEKEWNAWGDKLQEQLADSSDEAKQEAQDQIDAFIEASKAEIEDCTKAISEKAEQLSEKSSEAVKEFFPTINAVLTKIEECSTVSVKDVKGNAACAKEIRNEFRSLTSAPATILKLSIELGKSSVGSVESLTCVPKIIAQIEKNKIEVAKAISELAKQKDETTQTEDNEEPSEVEKEQEGGEPEEEGSQPEEEAKTEDEKPSEQEGDKPSEEAKAEDEQPSEQEGDKPSEEAKAEEEQPSEQEGDKPSEEAEAEE